MNDPQVSPATPSLAAHRLSVGAGSDTREIAVLETAGAAPVVVWLAGFKSDMRSTKATAVADWAAGKGRGSLRFDYSGHGESSGRFEDGTIGCWLEESLAVLRAGPPRRLVLVGSSMGGWIALLVARALAAAGEASRLAGMVLIAPAVDFTQVLTWERLGKKIQRQIETTGFWERPSAYSPEPYRVTRRLIEEGRDHLLFDGGPIRTMCPVHILQGMRDEDVPWQHAMTLVEHLAGDTVTLTLIKDGDHRLSRDEDIARLLAAIEAVA